METIKTTIKCVILIYKIYILIQIGVIKYYLLYFITKFLYLTVKIIKQCLI